MVFQEVACVVVLGVVAAAWGGWLGWVGRWVGGSLWANNSRLRYLKRSHIIQGPTQLQAHPHLNAVNGDVVPTRHNHSIDDRS